MPCRVYKAMARHVVYIVCICGVYVWVGGGCIAADSQRVYVCMWCIHVV